ncbi:MAG: 30S ribosomal protein S15 [Candidatus Bipolaricaulaceae bacterium]
MALTKKTKQDIVSKFARHPQDSGSPEVQIALLSARIAELTEHLKVHRKDFHSRRGLYQVVGQRRRLLRYLKENDPRSYNRMVRELGLRGV